MSTLIRNFSFTFIILIINISCMNGMNNTPHSSNLKTDAKAFQHINHETSHAIMQIVPTFPHTQNFWNWKNRCDTAIPHYKETHCKQDSQLNFSYKAASYAEFMDTAHSFIALQEKEFSHQSWVDNEKAQTSKKFMPFVQAVTVKVGTEIIIFGDRHGDVRSTLEMLALLSEKGYLDPSNPFKITNPDVLIVGLGDYVDRGNSGVETIQTLLWLKLCNPDQVILVRGNHEDYMLGVNQSQFQKEVEIKFGSDLKKDDLSLINSLYDYMPVAVFIGAGTPIVDFLVGCHGFIELGYHPEKLIELVLTKSHNYSCYEAMNTSNRAEYTKKLDTQARENLTKLSENKPQFATELTDVTLKNTRCPAYYNFNNTNCPYHLGWLWSYVLIDNGQHSIDFDTTSKTWQWGKQLTEATLQSWSKNNQYTVSWIFRGHQHSHNNEYAKHPEIMHKLWAHNGLYKAWTDDSTHSMSQPGAFTLMVAPDNNYAGFIEQAVYPGFNYDTWVIVKTGATAHQWSLKVLNKAMFALPEKAVIVDGKQIIPQLPFDRALTY